MSSTWLIYLRETSFKDKVSGKTSFGDTVLEKGVFHRYGIRERRLSEIRFRGKTSFRYTVSGKDVFLRYGIRERCLS